ncbi:MAG: gamma-glutamylcyclotransferase [Burkholderiales bacterium]|nr:gamma-glutamylcyclotransferase [Burkholderiales bacterium]
MIPTPTELPPLSRADLEAGRMRDLYAIAFGGTGHALDDAALATSLADTLAVRPKGAGWWVFAYGSLLWNPLFSYAEVRPALLHGRHRRFCLYSMAARGTPSAPGLVLALARGGACAGVVYRLRARDARDELALLWRREMVTGAYHPKWVAVTARDGREVVAVTFVLRRDHPQYAGHLDLAAQVALIAQAAGAFGTGRDYLARTRAALATHGIVDRYLETIAAKLAARSARAG